MEHNKQTIHHFFGSKNQISLILQDMLVKKKCIPYSRSDIEKMLIDNTINQLLIDQNCSHKIIYSWGVLYSKRLLEQTYHEACQSYVWNFLIPMKILEIFNKAGVEFKFIYVSSESARKGSFDGNYAAQKAASERFIRECKLLNSSSSIIGVAPSMICDAGMTTRRADRGAIQEAAASNPKGRLLKSREVAELIFWLLENSSSYITNTTIDINGGKFARMSYK